MSKKWVNNVELLNSIIEELITEENITDINFKKYIYLFYESELSKAYKNQLNYKTYNIMNKEIIKSVVDYIEFKKKQIYENQKKEQEQLQQNQTQNNLQKYQQQNNNNTIIFNKNQEIEEVYTREDIHDKRTQVFSNEYEKRKKEFEDSIVLKPPEDIDFTDKTEIPNTSIDELMEEEIKRRGYEINNDFKMSKEEAEKWIYGESGKPESKLEPKLEPKSKQNTNINTNNNIVKSVRFNDTIETKQDVKVNINVNTEPSFLSKLKKIQDEKKEIQQEIQQQEIQQQEIQQQEIQQQEIQQQEIQQQEQEPIDSLQLDIQEIKNNTSDNIKNEILQHIQKTIMCDNENIWFELNNTINNYDINIICSKNKLKIMFSKTQ